MFRQVGSKVMLSIFGNKSTTFSKISSHPKSTYNLTLRNISCKCRLHYFSGTALRIHRMILAKETYWIGGKGGIRKDCKSLVKMGKQRLKFPDHLTEEEETLKTKYENLRKMKQALEEMKFPKREPEKAIVLDAKEAKEHAKKLIQSGEVSLSSKSNGEKTGFKRPSRMFMDKKLSEPETSRPL